MNSNCSVCQSQNFSTDDANCRRCNAKLVDHARTRAKLAAEDDLGKKLDAGAIWFFKRFLGALLISTALLLLAYASMLYSAAPLGADQTQTVETAIRILEKQGFAHEAWILRHSSFRQNDNWFNAMTGHNDAYAATNFPFQIVTLYPDFFTVPIDDRERAVVLLHEAQHLQGAGEPKAYEAVWRSRHKLGWTRKDYRDTQVFRNVAQSTKQIAANLFICEGNYDNDCTE